MHGHLPFLLARVAPLMRHVTHLYHSATRVIELGLYSLQMPRRKPGQRYLLRRERASGRPRRHKSSSQQHSPLLIHFHIFKNAGTSFQWALQQGIGSRPHEYDPSSPDGLLSPKQLASYATRTSEARVIFTHQAALPPPRIRGRKVLSSILIRDPIARIRSIYAFERQQVHSSQGAVKAKELDFKGYVEWRLACSPAMFCNYQVYFCSRTAFNKKDEGTTETHLRTAIANLDLIDIVGTVERYIDWLGLAQSILSEFFPQLKLVVTRRNATSTSTNVSHAEILDHLLKDLGFALAERLLECNQLDMCLYQVAEALLIRRLAEHRVDIPLLKAYADVSKNYTEKL